MTTPAGPTCPGCAAPAPVGRRFCTACGTPLAASAPPSAIPTPSSPFPDRPVGERTLRGEPAWRSAPLEPPPAPATSAAPSRRGVTVPTGVLVGGGVALVAAVLLVVALVVVRPATGVAAPTPINLPATSVAASPSEAPGSTAGLSTAGVPTTEAPTTASADPEVQLDAIASADAASVESLVGSWVPQLSAKRDGLVADGITYDSASILANHESLQARYPGAKLLRSSDYSTYSSGGFWITVVPQPSSTPETANAWCDARGIAPTQCYAKLISHSASATGSTKLRAGS